MRYVISIEFDEEDKEHVNYVYEELEILLHDLDGIGLLYLETYDDVCAEDMELPGSAARVAEAP